MPVEPQVARVVTKRPSSSSEAGACGACGPAAAREAAEGVETEAAPNILCSYVRVGVRCAKTRWRAVELADFCLDRLTRRKDPLSKNHALITREGVLPTTKGGPSRFVPIADASFSRIFRAEGNLARSAISKGGGHTIVNNKKCEWSNMLGGFQYI